MGREKNILLGFLGLLAGVFVGVLSMKLLVPRPPAGTGPDIRADAAFTTPQERVEPPVPSWGGWDFSAAPPLVPERPAPTAEPVADPQPPAPRDAAPQGSRFARAAPVDAPAAAVDPPADGGVAPVSWEHADQPSHVAGSDLTAPPAADRFAPADAAPALVPPADTGGPPVRDPFVAPAAHVRPAPIAGDYLVQAGDSWWGVAEQAYGDGRLYRALFAWNRSRDPRVSLAPGTRLDVPPLVRLQAAWPRLLPPGGATSP